MRITRIVPIYKLPFAGGVIVRWGRYIFLVPVFINLDKSFSRKIGMRNTSLTDKQYYKLGKQLAKM